MRNLVTTFLVIGLIGAGCAGQSFGQTIKENKKDNRENREVAAASSLYIISAKAGAVNYVTGSVAVERKNAKNGYLVKGDNVEKGEKVKTGSDGKTEILLNPGSYVRLAENTNFNFDSTSLDDLQVSLNSGSAIFEILTDDDFKVFVKTPKSEFQLIKSGIYRIDALSDGMGKVSVWKGKAKFGEGKTDSVKGGQTTAIINGQVSVQKFDRDNKGEFELWSKDRAKEIASLNAKLQHRAMSRSLLSAYNQNGLGWARNRMGLWIYDAAYSGYCFLPYNYGWSSPYGFGFNRSIWNYNLPNQFYNNINPNWNNIRNPQNPNNYPNSPQNGGNPNAGNPNPPSMPIGNPSAPPPMSMPRPIENRPLEERNGSREKINMERPVDH